MGSDRRGRSGPPDPLQALYGRSRRPHWENREKREKAASTDGAEGVSATSTFAAPRVARRERRMARQEIAAAVEADLPAGTQARGSAGGGWLTALVRWVSWLLFLALALMGAAWSGYEYAPAILDRLERWLNGRI